MKHSLHYTYDEVGNKLKLTLENPVTFNGNKTIIITTYINGFVYVVGKFFHLMLRHTCFALFILLYEIALSLPGLHFMIHRVRGAPQFLVRQQVVSGVDTEGVYKII